MIKNIGCFHFERTFYLHTKEAPNSYSSSKESDTLFWPQRAIHKHGKAGKFDIIPTMTTIGSGIGIFGVATVLCDLLLLHILPKRHYYKQKKFKYAEDMGPGEGERDPAATSSTLGLQENMRTS